MQTSALLHKIEILPEHLQNQVLDYIEFLTSKYLYEQDNDSDFELTREMKSLLDESIIHHENHPEKALPANEVIEKLSAKYNYGL